MEDTRQSGAHHTSAGPAFVAEGETAVVVLTPPLPAAVAVVLVAGPQAVAIVESHFRSRSGRLIADTSPAQISLGEWSDGETLIVCRTATDQVELHPHGGPAAIARIVAQLTSSGCREVDWSCWGPQQTPHPLEAAAEMALREATTERALAILLDQASGVLTAELSRIADDAAGDELASAAAALDALLARSNVGVHLTNPWRVAVIGEPNVGKSSLINALLGYRRAIVLDRPGTTRDLVTATTAFDGWPVELLDTAGIHETPDAVEQAGIDLTTRAAATVDLIVLVSDATRPGRDPLLPVDVSQAACIQVHNKIDLVESDSSVPPDVLDTSAKIGTGVPQLIDAIVDHLVPCPPPPAAPVPFNSQIVDTLHIARNALAANRPSITRQILLDLIARQSAISPPLSR